MARQRIEPDSHVPIYIQIIEYLRSRIAAGVFRPGEALPSLRALALELKVNPNTVQRAYDEMDRQGMIRSKTIGSDPEKFARLQQTVDAALASP
jgi:DNA-binding transcriptional regulator YhcF (GntR family)